MRSLRYGSWPTIITLLSDGYPAASSSISECGPPRGDRLSEVTSSLDAGSRLWTIFAV